MWRDFGLESHGNLGVGVELGGFLPGDNRREGRVRAERRERGPGGWRYVQLPSGAR